MGGAIAAGSARSGAGATADEPYTRPLGLGISVGTGVSVGAIRFERGTDADTRTDPVAGAGAASAGRAGSAPGWLHPDDDGSLWPEDGGEGALHPADDGDGSLQPEEGDDTSLQPEDGGEGSFQLEDEDDTSLHPDEDGEGSSQLEEDGEGSFHAGACLGASPAANAAHEPDPADGSSGSGVLSDEDQLGKGSDRAIASVQLGAGGGSGSWRTPGIGRTAGAGT
jgi:hypothetical protein